ncbi:hypothetical protein HDE_14291 [Halotydeus destructor]|nr:hypothetical protein HDE_14291 [Halotydeus destructor]
MDNEDKRFKNVDNYVVMSSHLQYWMAECVSSSFLYDLLLAENSMVPNLNEVWSSIESHHDGLALSFDDNDKSDDDCEEVTQNDQLNETRSEVINDVSEEENKSANSVQDIPCPSEDEPEKPDEPEEEELFTPRPKKGPKGGKRKPAPTKIVKASKPLAKPAQLSTAAKDGQCGSTSESNETSTGLANSPPPVHVLRVMPMHAKSAKEIEEAGEEVMLRNSKISTWEDIVSVINEMNKKSPKNMPDEKFSALLEQASKHSAKGNRFQEASLNLWKFVGEQFFTPRQEVYGSNALVVNIPADQTYEDNEQSVVFIEGFDYFVDREIYRFKFHRETSKRKKYEVREALRLLLMLLPPGLKMSGLGLKHAIESGGRLGVFPTQLAAVSTIHAHRLVGDTVIRSENMAMIRKAMSNYLSEYAKGNQDKHLPKVLQEYAKAKDKLTNAGKISNSAESGRSLSSPDISSPVTEVLEDEAPPNLYADSIELMEPSQNIQSSRSSDYASAPEPEQFEPSQKRKTMFSSEDVTSNKKPRTSSVPSNDEAVIEPPEEARRENYREQSVYCTQGQDSDTSSHSVASSVSVPLQPEVLDSMMNYRLPDIFPTQAPRDDSSSSSGSSVTPPKITRPRMSPRLNKKK